MSWKIPLANIDLGIEEKNAVQGVLDEAWLTMGEQTSSFETEFASHIGAKHAIAVTNATAALHLACLAVGVQPGDEVIVPSLTFVATAASILYAGGTPVFADITSENDLNISLDSISQKVTDRTRAIIVVHYAGYPCDMPAITAFAKEHHLAVIEDAAHAPGSEIEGRKLGTWGDVGCFSFFSNKNMTTGEGGMLTTEDDALAEKMSRLRSHGMTSLTWDRHKGHAWSYDVVAMGFNYRIDEIRAALGRVQLKRLEGGNQHRRELTTLYRDMLQEMAPAVKVPFENHPGISSCHLLPILLPLGSNRIRFMELMKARGIQTSIHYPPIHQFSYYREQAFTQNISLPITDELAAREVTLPMYAGLTPQDVEYIVQAVRDALPELQTKAA